MWLYGMLSNVQNAGVERCLFNEQSLKAGLLFGITNAENATFVLNPLKNKFKSCFQILETTHLHTFHILFKMRA